MSEDPLYFPKDIPVYMILDMGDYKHMEVSQKVIESWNKHGYTVIKSHIQKSNQVDFQLYFSEEMYQEDKYERQHWYDHFRLWKKVRSTNTPSIIITWRNYLQKDIPRGIYDRAQFFPLQHPYHTSYWDKPNVHEQYSGGYFITPLFAKTLISTFKNVNIHKKIDEMDIMMAPPTRRYPFDFYTIEYV